ncbi:MAG: autotransporter-associated beta strand repeat-containing protein, partial [Thermoguttaceae bacterium]
MSRKTHLHSVKCGIALLALALCLLTAASAQAASLYWNPTAGGNGNWDTVSTNLMWGSTWASPPNIPWSGLGTDDATFRGGVAGNITVDAGGINVHSIFIGNSSETTANTYTFSGGQITFGGTAPNIIGVTNAADTVTINSVITGSSLYFNNSSGSASGGTNYGSGNLVITSDNSSTLTGNVEVGGYNQGGGGLRITKSGALGTSSTIEINGNNTCTAHLDLDGSAGGLTITNSNFRLHGRSGSGQHGLNLAPEIVNYAGSNSISPSGSTPYIYLDSGGIDYIIQSDSGTLTLNGINGNDRGSDRWLYLQGNANGEVTGSITSPTGTNNFRLMKEGSGTWTLSGANSYTGATAVDVGALRLKNSSALPATTAAVTVAGGTATSRIELDGSTSALSIGNVITLQGRSAATSAHLLNVAGNNAFTSAGDISLVEGGDLYVIQSDAGKLSLYNIKNNAATSYTTPRIVTLQGAGNGEVTGVIGGGSNTNPINITKSGSGTWTLKGANTTTGSFTVNGGTLVLDAAGSIASSPVIDVQGSGIFDVTGFGGSGFTLGASTAQKLQGTGTVNGTIINGSAGTISPAGNGTAGTLNIQNLTLGSVSGGIVNFDLSSSTSSGNDLLNVTGNLSALGSSSSQSTTFNINMTSGSLATGTYKLVNYGTWAAGGSINNIGLSGLGAGAATTRQSFGLSRTGNEIDLTVSGTPENLVWKGNISSDWNRNPAGTLNWLKGATPDYYYDLDNVTFNATGAAQPIVNITGVWTPGSIVVDAATDYTFTGTGNISGSTAMTFTKSGTGKLILKNTGVNSYGGTTTINAGTLQIGDGGANGSIGAGGIVDNAALVFNQSSSYATAATNVISGAGSLQKLGTGTLTLNGNSPSFTGAVTISGGTIVMGGANALGSTTSANSITISNNAALDVNGNSLGARSVSVQGAGPDGTSGAIVSSATADQINAFRYVSLTGPTTFGGTGRWDIRSSSGGSLTGGGYALTKVGTNLISLVNLGDTGLGDINVKNGILMIEGSTTMGSSGTVTVESGAMLSMYAITTTLTKNLKLKGGTLGTSFGDAGTANNYGGAVTLVGGGNLSPTVTTSGTSGFTVSGSIGGTGLLTKSGTAGTVILTGTANSWDGGT